MSLDSIKGQSSAVAALTAALASGRMPSTWLFAGPDGVGKSLAAHEVARALLCHNGPRAACGKCPSCHRVDARTHGDLFELTVSSERSNIVVDDVRLLCEFIAQTPMEGARKVAIVDPADAMTDEAQNAFLKTLEEPPADTAIILVAVNSDALLPTVRSRSRRVSFARIPDALVKEFLVKRGAQAADAAVLARLADGSFGAAQKILDAGDGRSRREFFEALLSARPGDLTRIGDLIAGESGRGKKARKEQRQDAAARLAALHSFCVDALRAASGAAVRTNADVALLVERFAAAAGYETLAELEKEVSDAIIVLTNYADLRLVCTRVAAAFIGRAVGRRIEA